MRNASLNVDDRRHLVTYSFSLWQTLDYRAGAERVEERLAAIARWHNEQLDSAAKPLDPKQAGPKHTARRPRWRVKSTPSKSGTQAPPKSCPVRVPASGAQEGTAPQTTARVQTPPRNGGKSERRRYRLQRPRGAPSRVRPLCHVAQPRQVREKATVTYRAAAAYQRGG